MVDRSEPDNKSVRQSSEQVLRETDPGFRGTFENAAVGIIHCDQHGHFLRVNQKYCDIVGYSREELMTMTFEDLTHPDDISPTREKYIPLFRGELSSYSEEKRDIRKDGSLVWIHVSVSLQRDPSGKPMHAIGILQDISIRKRLEEELRQAKEAAEAANRAKDEFLANVSHEIRTPMNAILGMTELTLDTPLTDDQRQCLRTVKSAADNLLIVINDLLDFVKIEAGKMELDPADFSLRQALGDTLRALSVRAHRKNLELVSSLQPDVPDALIGDAGRLRQVLLNLVDNALKFTAEGEVLVRVERGDAVSSPDEIELRFTISDTGIGIPQGKQDKIFRAFEQEDTSTTRRYGGTGLGLTIASRLVDLMNGAIHVTSQPGVGSTFFFTARFRKQAVPRAEVPAQPLVILQNLPVLVVDDNATNRRVLAEWLRGWHMRPDTVSSGLAALDAIWHGTTCGQPYALVLLDARMPDTDGLALASRIRQRAELSVTRIILMTSGDRPGDVALLREQGITAHLVKPIQQEELLETIQCVMGRSGCENADLPRRELVAARVASADSRSIILAEDNEFNAQLLEQLLLRRGHRVRLAMDGRQTLDLLAGQAFDLLLLDVHMPVLDGFQVIRAIREDERASGKHLPVVALTARSREEDRQRCLQAGMDGFLTKPIQAANLWAAIDRLRVPSLRGSAGARASGSGRVACRLRRRSGDSRESLRKVSVPPAGPPASRAAHVESGQWGGSARGGS